MIKRFFAKRKAWKDLCTAIKERKPMKEILRFIDLVNNFYPKKK